MEIYEQDFKTVVRVSFSEVSKTLEATTGFWCGEWNIERLVAQLGRSFRYDRPSWSKEEENWVLFLEGFGEFVRTDYYRGEGDVYQHTSEENGTIEVWYEVEFDEDFKASKVD